MVPRGAAGRLARALRDCHNRPCGGRRATAAAGCTPSTVRLPRPTVRRPPRGCHGRPYAARRAVATVGRTVDAARLTRPAVRWAPHGATKPPTSQKQRHGRLGTFGELASALQFTGTLPELLKDHVAPDALEDGLGIGLGVGVCRKRRHGGCRRGGVRRRKRRRRNGRAARRDRRHRCRGA